MPAHDPRSDFVPVVPPPLWRPMPGPHPCPLPGPNTVPSFDVFPRTVYDDPYGKPGLQWPDAQLMRDVATYATATVTVAAGSKALWPTVKGALSSAGTAAITVLQRALLVPLFVPRFMLEADPGCGYDGHRPCYRCSGNGA